MTASSHSSLMSRQRRWASRLATALLMGLTVAQPMAAQAQALRFIRDAEIEDLLSDYARPIFQVAGLGAQKVKVRIIQDNSFNAFVLDGRNVFINTGALTGAKTPNAVIGVLAHETGHISGGHLASLRAKMARDSSMTMLMQIMGIGAMIAGAAGGKDGNGGTVAGVGQSVLSASGDVAQRSILSYRRVQEYSADQAGVRFLNATKQSGQGMLATFRKFAEDEMLSGIGNNASYAGSHPMARDRIAQLQTLAEASPFFDAKDSGDLQLRHDLMKAKLIGFLEPPQAVFNRYPTRDASLPARYARSIAAFSSGGLPAALPLIDDILREQPANAYFWEQKADFLSRGGKHADAATALRKALSLLPTQSLMQAELAQELLGTQDKRWLPEIVKLLRKTVVVDDNPSAYRQLATAYFGLGEPRQCAGLGAGRPVEGRQGLCQARPGQAPARLARLDQGR
jgi:predicted Zn-dependent protease